MKNREIIKQRILEEDDFVYCPRLSNSLKNLIETNPEGVDEDRMSRVLLMTAEEIEEAYQSAVKKIKKKLGV